jgi:hypothetical protein
MTFCWQIEFLILADCYATLRYATLRSATLFLRKFSVNFFLIFFGYRGSTANLGHACKNLGGLGLLVWEEIDPAQTVVNPKLKLIYRFRFQLLRVS